VALNPGETLVTVIGGSGFLGRHVVRSLARRGYRIRAACRRPDLAVHLQPLGMPGQVMPVQANVRYPASLAAVCDGAAAVINLTGVLHDAGAQSLDAIHVFGAEASAKAAQAAGPNRGASIRAPKPRARRGLARISPAPLLRGRQSCSVPRMDFSIALPPWRDSRRLCL
jgi:uncharacterized protein YbjT (DUF2867 family)